ncbi:MAG: VTT domain-containing protein [Anaerolineae bacterium]|nr:VTT domain-containing protein [Anaerolineae bacterium]
MEAAVMPEAGPPPAQAQGAGRSPIALRVLALVVALGITVAIILLRDELARFAAYGYIGIFVVSVVGNATVLLPVPSLLAVFAGGTAFNPLLTGLVAGVAEPLGELTGYLAGFGGSAIIENQARYEQMRHWMRRHGFATIVVLSAIPNPIFDLAGITAGALHMPVWRFLLACWLGKTAKALAIAWLGSQSVRWVEPLLRLVGAR